jgi:hypothetical protein
LRLTVSAPNGPATLSGDGLEALAEWSVKYLNI